MTHRTSKARRDVDPQQLTDPKRRGSAAARGAARAGRGPPADASQTPEKDVPIGADPFRPACAAAGDFPRGQPPSPAVARSRTELSGSGETLYPWSSRRADSEPLSLLSACTRGASARYLATRGRRINGVIEALNRADGKIEFIQARHEEMAAFMASAYAKFTGELGVCLATSGPGASHLITGMYDARLDHMPVLAITGQQSRNAIGGHYQQEVDLVSMFKDVAGAFVRQASSPAQVRHLVDRAIRIALGERRVTAMILPNDLQDEPYQQPPRKHGTVHSGVGFAKPRTTPFEADLRRPPTF